MSLATGTAKSQVFPSDRKRLLVCVMTSYMSLPSGKDVSRVGASLPTGVDAPFSVKAPHPKTREFLTGESHAGVASKDQALAVEMKPNLARALIQRGALR